MAKYPGFSKISPTRQWKICQCGTHTGRKEKDLRLWNSLSKGKKLLLKIAREVNEYWFCTYGERIWLIQSRIAVAYRVLISVSKNSNTQTHTNNILCTTGLRIKSVWFLQISLHKNFLKLLPKSPTIFSKVDMTYNMTAIWVHLRTV